MAARVETSDPKVLARRTINNAWYSRNADKIRIKRRERYLSDPVFKAMRLKHASAWEQKYPERRRAGLRRWEHNALDLRKEAVINVLTDGEQSCRWCGQCDLDVLTLDHINDNGSQHRKELGNKNIYRWLIENDYPAGLQVLCFNCNRKKQILKLREGRKRYARTA